MKNFISLFLIISVLFCFTLTGCSVTNSFADLNEGVQDPLPEENGPTYSSEYSFNEFYHWRAEIDGDGYTDYATHENLSGRCVCGKYFECPNLTYELRTVYGHYGYCISAYDGENVNAYDHIEIPAFYQGENDVEPIPVIAIGGDVFSVEEHSTYNPIKSIKLNEGLLFIGNGAFEGTLIEEVKLPDSLIGGCLTYDFSRWPEHGGLYNVFAGCSLLSKVNLGNGLKVIGAYTFAYCNSLKSLNYGNVHEIRQRAFYESYFYNEVVVPATITSIPEGSYWDQGAHFDENNNNDLQRWLSETNVFPHADNVYLCITKDEYLAMRIGLLNRNPSTGVPYDGDGNELDPNTYATTYGFTEGWCGMAKVYYLGEWHYDENGNPVKN